MATFLIESYWVGVVQEEAGHAVDELRRADVTPLASFLVPSEETVFVLVEASSPAAVFRAARHARIPADRVSSVVELASESGPLR
ncbi:MAG TPA: hypothetical protein VHK89_01900 [Actinomycetota bacterium]|jgi:hypothetical protein|nr:hypothetical protein [Actinomycetota bacterium]